MTYPTQMCYWTVVMSRQIQWDIKNSVPQAFGMTKMTMKCQKQQPTAIMVTAGNPQ